MKVLKGLLINNSEKVKVIYMEIVKKIKNEKDKRVRAYGSTMGLEAVYKSNGKEFIGRFKGINEFKGKDKYEYSIEGGIILLDNPAEYIKLVNCTKRMNQSMYESKKQTCTGENGISSKKQICLNKNAISSAKI